MIKDMKLTLLLLLISNVLIFPSEAFEEIFITNCSNRFDYILLLKSKTKFGSFILSYSSRGYIDLSYNIQIINNIELTLKKIYINGISIAESPINTYFIDGVNHFDFYMTLFSESEKVNKIRKFAEINGIDIYVECFDEINNEKKKYSFKVSRENSVHFYSAFDMIYYK
ncbi:hypothetical protein [Borreliella turdi]|uniref:hypothetical protein n=1 Tax=Borreliella turdi TaxID=57863 RepID=UPI001F19F5DF|nr:hypothetical protein [Borreliella turdi]